MISMRLAVFFLASLQRSGQRAMFLSSISRAAFYSVLLCTDAALLHMPF